MARSASVFVVPTKSFEAESAKKDRKHYTGLLGRKKVEFLHMLTANKVEGVATRPLLEDQGGHGACKHKSVHKNEYELSHRRKRRFGVHARTPC